MRFEAISGLRVNMYKSELVPVGSVEDLALELGCKVARLPSTYLGMSLGTPSSLWQLGMELRRDFVRDWLRGSRLYITKGGQITLIRSTLSNLSIYFMSILHLLRVVKLRLEQI